MALNLHLHSGKRLLQNTEIWSHGREKLDSGIIQYTIE